ncbi:Hypothetical Protein FCC1311_003922 [Hondaea fermentalgiana]|uniref:BZIP domain-containing protein n=1 Tax=Hondaea fermentalgiana TaxID=2315210 RepID=A0A2R5G935_9STRA|nr:Hypothetical Protein FCC1311_003922 [Hondaea fermentalgiana]|eukprot:GBG24174.1 Hypothetical Protein FCC1311_003922 [Hondaea fermentalgiana]
MEDLECNEPLAWGAEEESDVAEETFFKNDFFPASLVLNEDDLQLLTSSDSSEGFAEETDESLYQAQDAEIEQLGTLDTTTSTPPTTRSETRCAETENETNIKTEDSEEVKNRRRAVVAAASRATRAKRKREREALQVRNKELEQEREIYLSRIARLQTEVQAFRDAGSANLEMENKLLRVEIRKHKAFIRTIVNATRAVPQMTLEERYRLFRRGAESAVSQVVGLMFTSMADPSWTWSIVDLLQHDNTQGPCRIGVQLLPLGCTAQTAKRVNARIDMPLRPESIKELGQKLWNIWIDPNVYSKVYSESFYEPHGVKMSSVELKTGFDELRDEKDPDLRVFHYKEHFQDGPAKVRDCINAGAQLDPDDAFIICSSTSKEDAGLQPPEEGVHRINEPLIEGHVLRSGPGGKGCYWTDFVSLPLLDTGFAGCSVDGGLLSDEFALGEVSVKLFNSLIAMINEMD